MRATTSRYALVLVLLLCSAALRAQEPRPAELRREAFAEGETIALDWAWRFHAGDDPRWSEPSWDDSGWEIVEPLLPPEGLPAGRWPPGSPWPGVGWFRRHLRLEPARAGPPLLIRIEAPGAAWVFLDGELLLRFEGTAGRGAAAQGGFAVATFSPRVEHTLAVRYELPRERFADAAPAPLGFRLSIEPAGPAGPRLAAERRRVALAATFIAIPAFLAMLHLALFWSYPKARENLYYAGSMAAFAGIVLFDQDLTQVTGAAWKELAPRANTLFIVATIFFIQLTYLAVRIGRLPRTWIGFAVAGTGLAAWSWIDPSPVVRSWVWYLYFGAMLVQVFRVETRGPKLRREGTSTLLGGLTILGAIILLELLVDAGALPALASISGVYVFGMLAFAVGMSLFLAGNFARTSTHLERRLVEVNTLSNQVLAQERAAHEQELVRRLLEAEDARKGSEIAAARHLQLSMLPASLPQVPGIETAAVMTTATEVGGDYYDFKDRGDGTLIVALGDATGHGVAAGTMVTAVKAIFSVLGTESLPEMLAECDRVLRGMNVRPLHMCLTLARISPREVAVCSAAMPPVLLYRAASGEVEEIGAGGLPLGARLSASWQERSTPLSPGDTLLFATDGLAELRHSDGAELGFDGAAGAFREVAGSAAGEVLERLMERVAAWRGDRLPTDDLTLVVVRAVPEPI